MKRQNRRMFVAGLALICAGVTSSLSAGTTVYVHGYQPFTKDGNSLYENCHDSSTCAEYFSQTTTTSGYETRRMVGWKAHMAWPYYGVPRTLEILNKYCRDDKCRIVCHSTGCPVTTYILDKYPGQYQIDEVIALGSAEGGSELATMKSAADIISVGFAFFFTGNGSWWLMPGNIRSYYNHDDTDGVRVYHQSGRKGKFLASSLLPGEDDGTVAFHSACAYTRLASMSQCWNAQYTCNKRKRKRKWKCHWEGWKLKCGWKSYWANVKSSCYYPHYSNHQLTSAMKDEYKDSYYKNHSQLADERVFHTR